MKISIEVLIYADFEEFRPLRNLQIQLGHNIKPLAGKATLRAAIALAFYR